jgi:hypothetical protein
MDPYATLNTAIYSEDSMQQHGPTHVISRVRDLEDADPSGSRWPRYKRSDDATAAFCLLRHAGTASLDSILGRG